MKRTIRILAFALIALHACVDPIEFEPAVAGESLVFYGNFTQLNEDHEFFISRTTDFGTVSEPVTQASVVIKDNEGNCGDYIEGEGGTYILSTGAFQGIPGRSYHIEIALENGKSYFTIPQVLPTAIETSKLYYDIVKREEISSSGISIEKTFIDIKIDAPLVNDEQEISYLRWAVDEVYSFTDRKCGQLDPTLTCYFQVPVDGSASLLFDTSDGDQEDLIGFNVRSRVLLPYGEFTGRHYFIVRQNTISEETYNYWEKINVVSNQSGSLFDRQPAKVRGNIYETDNEGSFVIGNFDVSGQVLNRVYTTPRDIKPHQAIFTCMDISYFANHLTECCYCYLKLGDQIERPDYWGR